MMKASGSLRKLFVLIGLLTFSGAAVPHTGQPGRDIGSGSIYPEIAQLLAGDGEEFAYFGTAVAVSGDTIAVGAPSHGSTGVVYIYERNLGGPDNWGEAAVVAPDDPTLVQSFGNSVDLDGDTLVVGAPTSGIGNPIDPVSGVGLVFVFQRNLRGPGNWGETARLSASDAEEHDNLGNRVSVDGDTIVAGAFAREGDTDPPNSFFGAAYIFERDLGGSENWGEAAALSASEPSFDDYFGISVAISGDTVAIGAHSEDGGPGDPLPDTGAVFIFERDLGGPENWGEAAVLYAGDGGPFDQFGFSVGLDGDTLVVGANREDGGPGNPILQAGAAYVFERNLGGPGNWGEAAKLSAGDAQADDHFGQRAAISGDIILIFALYEDGGRGDPVEDAGAGYVFERDLGGSENWGQAAKLVASGSDFDNQHGDSAALDGDVLVLGAPLMDFPPGSNVGAAFVYHRIQLDNEIYMPVVIQDP